MQISGSLTRRAQEIIRGLPHCVVADRTAAWLWGIDALPPGADQSTWPVELIGDQPPPPGTEVRAAFLSPDDIAETASVRLTTRERTALDCARLLPRLEAVAAVDQFLRAGLDLADLRKRTRGEARARSVLAQADPGAVLPGESWTRVRILEAGLPRPRSQIPVPSPFGPDYLLDLGYEDFRTAVEYDGERFHTTRAHQVRDRARRAWIGKSHGWEILVVTKEDVLYRPAPFLEALTTLLMQRGWQPTPAQLARIELKLTRLRRRHPR